MIVPASRRRLALSGLGVALLAGAVACRHTPTHQGVPASSGGAEAPAPRLALSGRRYELGSVVQDQEVQKSIAIGNTGSRPLEISRVDPSRFCSGRLVTSSIAPARSAELQVTCRSDLHGPMRERIVVHSNDPRASEATVELWATVTPLLAFESASVELAVPFGRDRNQEIRLTGTLADQARLGLKSPGDDRALGVNLLPAGDGKKAGVSVRCRGQHVGSHVVTVAVTTGLERPREIALPCSCKVAGTLEVSPTNPYFNLKVSGPKVVWITVKSSQPDFSVREVHVTEGPFSASLEPGDAGAFRVKVTVLEKRIEEEARSVTGKLLIASNDRTEPRKELPLFGFGKINREPTSNQ